MQQSAISDTSAAAAASDGSVSTCSAASRAIPNRDPEKRLGDSYGDEFSCISAAAEEIGAEAGVPAAVEQPTPAANLKRSSSSSHGEVAAAAGSSDSSAVSRTADASSATAGSREGRIKIEEEAASRSGVSGAAAAAEDENATSMRSEDSTKSSSSTKSTQSFREAEAEISDQRKANDGEDIDYERRHGRRRRRESRRKQRRKNHDDEAAMAYSCRAESLRFVTAAAYDACRKAAAAALGRLSKSKRKVIPSVRASLALLLVAKKSADPSVAAAERYPPETEKAPPATPPTDAGGDPPFSADLRSDQLRRPSSADVNSSPPPLLITKPAAAAEDASDHKQHEDHGCPMYRIASPSKATPSIPSTTGTSDAAVILPTEFEAAAAETKSAALLQQQKLLLLLQEKEREMEMEKAVVDVDFFDAPSRFGSRSSTPARTVSSSSSCYNYSAEDQFLDASSSPFSASETPPRIFSVSVDSHGYGSGGGGGARHSHGQQRSSAVIHHPDSAAAAASSFVFTRKQQQQSKLSKRVGKTLRLDVATRGVRAADGMKAAAAASSDSDGVAAVLVNAYDGAPLISRSLLISTKGRHVEDDEAETNGRMNKIKGDAAAGRSFVMRRLESPSVKKPTLVQQVSPVFPAKCQKNRLNVMGANQRSSTLTAAAAAALRRPLAYNCSAADVGWPLGISGYPEALLVMKSAAPKVKPSCFVGAAAAVPSPPVPPTPAGGSWLKKALTGSRQLRQSNSGLVRVVVAGGGRSPSKKSTGQGSAGSKKSWEDMVRGSHGLMYGEV